MTNRKRHVLTLTALLGLSCLVQVVVIGRATVPGLDAVRFVETARQIDHRGLLPAVRVEREQPLFPAWVWLVHKGWQQTAGPSRWDWATSAQLAAAIPLVLAVVPLYFLLLRLAGSAAAAAGSFFFCLLPDISRLGADGISDSTHLLLFCLAFWAVVEYLASCGGCPDADSQQAKPRGRPTWLLLAGLATATALLARVEVLVLAAALGLTLVMFQFQPGRRQAWKRLAAAAGCFVLGLAAVLGPYLAMVGFSTPRAAVARVLGRAEAETPTEEDDSLVPKWSLGPRLSEDVLSQEAMSFAARDPSVSLRRRGYPAAIARFGGKLADVFGYWIGALALLGAWRMRRNTASAGDRFAQVFFLLFSVAAIRFSAAEGYLDPRHLLPLVVTGLAAAGYGAVELGSWLQRMSRTNRARSTVTWAVVALAGVACLPQTFMRLHHSRAGHRAAGEWLARCAELPGAVLDTRGWTGLYSGRRTYPYEKAPAVLGDSCLAYVVVEGREFGYDSSRSRTLRLLIERAAQPAGEFPDPALRKPNQQPVLVYRWDPDRFACRADSPGNVAISLREMKLRLAERDGYVQVPRNGTEP